MKFVKKEYDQHYHENFAYREHENSQRNLKRLALLLEQRQAGDLLEIGCGTGGFLRLAEKHFRVQGFDVSKYAVQRLQPHFGERVRVVNAEQQPLPRAQYDVIVVFNILEHLRQPHKVVAKIASALKPGGLMIGSVPNNQSIIGGTITRIGNFVDRTHVSTFSPPVWERIFKHAGFLNVRLFGEVNIGRNRCAYLHTPLWPHLAFNLMFTAAA